MQFYEKWDIQYLGFSPIQKFTKNVKKLAEREFFIKINGELTAVCNFSWLRGSDGGADSRLAEIRPQPPSVERRTIANSGAKK